MNRNCLLVVSLTVFLTAGALLAGHKGAMWYRQRLTDAWLEEARVSEETSPVSDPESGEETFAVSEEPTVDGTEGDTETPTEEATETEAETESPPALVRIPVDFEELQKKNPDIYGWITIPDTKIDLPLLQSSTEEPDYYLDHTVTGARGLPGSLYTQSVYNGRELKDRITVIYGHNMKNGSMFGELDRYSDPEFREAHAEILVYTPEKRLTYQVIFAVTYDNRLIPYYYDPGNDTEFLQFVDSVRENRSFGGYVQDPLEIQLTDRILVLSTCNGNSSERYLVGALLVEERDGE